MKAAVPHKDCVTTFEPRFDASLQILDARVQRLLVDVHKARKQAVKPTLQRRVFKLAVDRQPKLSKLIGF